MKRPKFSSVVAVLFVVLTLAAPAWGAPPSSRAIEEFADDYLARREARGFGKSLTMTEALLVQKAMIKRLQPALGKPVGYKVGLVTREMQERFDVEAPVRGVLLEKMLLQSGDEVPANFAVRPLLEADLIVVVADKGINKARSVIEVAEHLKEIVAFIELPDAFIATNPPPTGALLTAGNVGARLGVLGQRAPVLGTAQFVKALGDMKVTINDHTGAELGSGEGRVILDHPLNAVLWLMEELNRSGERLKAGDLISLGSIKAIPAPSGKTVSVRYQGLPSGPLEVSVRLR